jgi:hypothetical protein
MKTGFRKKDWILVIIVLCVAGIAYLSHQWMDQSGASKIAIKVDGEIQGTYSLAEDQVVEINQGSNVLEIQDGEASMIEADCPDQLCVHQRAISKKNESIICLPHKIVVEVTEGEDSEYDAIAN